MQRLPDAIAAPAGEALENRVPLAIGGRQQAPLRPRPQHPQDRHQEGPAAGFRGHADMPVGRQYRVDRLPFFVADFEPVHHRQKALTFAVNGACVNRT
jgi:hypothetical protein